MSTRVGKPSAFQNPSSGKGVVQRHPPNDTTPRHTDTDSDSDSESEAAKPDLGRDSDTTPNISSEEEDTSETDPFEGDLDEEEEEDLDQHYREEVFSVNQDWSHYDNEDEFTSSEEEETSEEEPGDDDKEDSLSPESLSDGQSFENTDGLVYSKRKPGFGSDRIYIMYYETVPSKVGAIFKSGLLPREEVGLLGPGVYVARQAEEKSKKVVRKLLVYPGEFYL